MTKYFLGLYYAYNQKGELMLKKIQLKLATKRLEKKSARKATKKARKQATNNTWAKTKEIIAKPFKYIAKLFKRFWLWVCNIDLVGLVNITLLSAIIVLFSMLIIDFTGCNKKPVVVVAKKAGYEDKQMVLRSNLNKVAILNLTFWPSWLTDVATGGMWQYSRDGVYIDMERSNLKHAELQKAKQDVAIIRGTTSESSEEPILENSPDNPNQVEISPGVDKA